jgi:hypothetical protein
MKKKLASLIDVKSIVTIGFTICFAVLALTGVINGDDFMTTFLIIITYYFTKKSDETVSENKDTD